MSFKNFLLSERLSLSIAKKYAKDWDKTRYSEWFGGKYRIYLPLESNEPDKKLVAPNKLHASLYFFGYEIVDYRKGLARKRSGDDKRLFKIGAILQKLSKTAARGQDREEAATSLRLFQSDSNRSLKSSESLVVISRHPVDIAGMSTDRGWTSCMDLKDGSNRRYCSYDISEGTLIAYLVHVDDKNVNHPIARLLIKPYLSDEGQAYLVPEGFYGTKVAGFAETVQKWLDEKQDGIYGEFKANSMLYRDQAPSKITIRDVEELKPMVKELKGLTIEDLAKRLPKNAKFKGGTFTFIDSSRLDFSGTWIDGDFETMVFLDGTFKNGSIQNSSVRPGVIFENGLVKTGVTFRGIFQDGIWVHNIFNVFDVDSAIWKKGRYTIHKSSKIYNSSTMDPIEAWELYGLVIELADAIYSTTKTTDAWGEDLPKKERVKMVEDWLRESPVHTLLNSRPDLIEVMYQYGLDNGLEHFENLIDSFIKWRDTNEL